MFVAFGLVDLAIGWPLRGTDGGASLAWHDSQIRWLLYVSPLFRYGDFLLGCLTSLLDAKAA